MMFDAKKAREMFIENLDRKSNDILVSLFQDIQIVSEKCERKVNIVYDSVVVKNEVNRKLREKYFTTKRVKDLTYEISW